MNIHDYRVIDLTHTLFEEIPIWPGSMPFSRELKSDYEQGCRVYNYSQTAGIATHMDAPVHFVRNGSAISDIPVEKCIAKACVIDISKQVAENADHALTVSDVVQWEKKHGEIPAASLVLLLTSWAEFWENPTRYCNKDDHDVMHFPGFGEDAAELLVDRGIVGVGIDTLSIDPGCDAKFAAHHVFLNAGLYQLENLNNLAQLPPIGATVFALPMKIKNGPEASARVVAFVGK